MESLDAKIKSLKTKLGKFEYFKDASRHTDYTKYAPDIGQPPQSSNLAFITTKSTYTYIDNRLQNHCIIENLLQREYWNIEDFLDGIRDCLLDLISLVPMPLSSNYVNCSLTHRNNLFLATSALGYMNMRNIEYSLRYNVYTDVKLGCFELLNKIPHYFGSGTGMRFYANEYKLLEDYFRNVNILENVNKGLLDSTNTKLTAIVDKKPNQHLQDFLQLRLNTATPSDKEHISKNITDLWKYCRIYTHPYFNCNSHRYLGTAATDAITLWGTGGKEITPPRTPHASHTTTNFFQIIANELSKHTVMHFIKYNFDKSSTLDNYGNRVQGIIETLKAPSSPNTKPFYENWVRAKNYFAISQGNVSNMKSSIVRLFDTWYTLLNAFNDRNRTLFNELISSQTAPTPIRLSQPGGSTGGNEYLELSGALDTNELHTKFAPKLLELFTNTINIERVREYADKFLRDGLFLYLVYYNLMSESQYNIPVHKYYKAKASGGNVADFIEFVYCYLEGLREQKDIDSISQIAKLSTNYTPAYFNNYSQKRHSIQDFINQANKPGNYADQCSCLNSDFYKVVSRFIGHILTKYKSTTPVVDIKYAHDQLIGVDGNIFYGSDIFTLASKILSLESKSFAIRKESLMLELYKNLELPKHLQAFIHQYKTIYTNPTIANNLILAGGARVDTNDNSNELNIKTRKYKLNSFNISKSAKLTMIINKYNEKTKKNLFQAKSATCNCNGDKRRSTKKLIDF